MPEPLETYNVLKWYTYAKYLSVWKAHFGEMDVAMVDGSLGDYHVALPLRRFSEEEFEQMKLARAQAYFDITRANQQGDEDALYAAMADCLFVERNLLLDHFSVRDDD